ncbi:MAG TPA: phosphopantetheine-binding protein [Candidatus Paceibacterota bacterium]|nr:phosphopantetheine-binding protein [Candidatus Paceibacterota bacterium]
MEPSPQIQNEVIDIIARALALNPHSIRTDMKISDLSEDSIQLFELLLTFEAHYQFETTYEDVAELQTVSDIIRYVSRETSRKKDSTLAH